MSKRCFTFANCELQAYCEHGVAHPRGGYFDPGAVGEHCNHFSARDKRQPFPHDDLVEKLQRMAGSHE